ncbi:MAG TPA: hypothetical protein DEB21_20715 [Rhodospirillaceae bacterium]|nr:hypothetical protein [Rhodospirillaceae bacterium]
MKNRLTDLNNHLFTQMERLSEEGLSGEQIDQEVKRAAAMVGVADKIIGNARLGIDACRLVVDHGDRFLNHLPMITGPREKA